MSGELGVALVVVFLAGMTTGLTGFGFALVMVPPLLLVYDPRTVLAIRFLLSLAGGWVSLLDSWRSASVRTLAGLVPWACAGMYFGIRMLEGLPVEWLKLLASLVVIVFALVLLRGPGGRSNRAESRLATAAAGLSSGTLATSTGLSGPPIIMLFTSRGYGVQQFRATIVMYLLLLDSLGLAALIASGAIQEAHLRTAGVLLPAAIVGRIVGIGLVRRVTPQSFRRITLFLLIVTGTVGAINAMIAML